MSLTKDARRNLNPPALSKINAILSSGWSRKPIVRQITAGALVLLAAILAVRGNPHNNTRTVLIASHDLHPGDILDASDILAVQRPSEAIPSSTLTSFDQLNGRTIASPVREGETITDVRIIGPRLAAAAASTPEARIVPIHLPDPALTDLIREGDIVDVLAISDNDTQSPSTPPLVLATKATVILVSPKPSAHTNSERVVLLALPVEQANIVAATALIRTITVTFH